jgi:uncharacterized protein (UPF0276 family)
MSGVELVGSGRAYLSHLPPYPYTDETLGVVGHHMMKSESGRRILVENPSSYLRFRHSTGRAAVPRGAGPRTGCGLSV